MLLSIFALFSLTKGELRESEMTHRVGVEGFKLSRSPYTSLTLAFKLKNKNYLKIVNLGDFPKFLFRDKKECTILL